MADKWEELFRTLAENTHSITQILDETNEGDELDEKYKVWLEDSFLKRAVANDIFRRSRLPAMPS